MILDRVLYPKCDLFTYLTNRQGRNRYSYDVIGVDHRLAIASAISLETNGKISRLLACALPSVNTTKR